MPKLGVYADLPMPAAWEGLLLPLRAVPPVVQARALPSLGALVDACLEPLSETQRQIVWGRLGAELTLQELGEAQGVTRERIRQIVHKQTRLFMVQPVLWQVLRGVREALDRAGAMTADVSEARSALVPTATPDQLWRFVTAIWKDTGAPDLATVPFPVAPNHWLYASGGLLDSKALKRAMLESPSFVSLGDLAQRLDVSEAELAALWPACSQLRRGANGLFSYGGWTLPDWLRAIAEQLALHGITEWHFSQLGRALCVVAPDDYPETLPSRNISAVISRPTVPHFEYAGRKGFWRLRGLGDGHANNFSAVAAILESSDLPLHTSDIQQRLERDVARATIYALLDREPCFTQFGNGVFGLQNKTYPKSYPEEDWLLELFAEQGLEALSADDAHQAALQAGLSPERLCTIGRFSARYRWWQRGKHAPRYLTGEHARHRRFRSWYDHRFERRLPPPGVLLGGLQAAFAARDSTVLVQSYLCLKELGEGLPTAAVPWVDWALDRETL